MSKSATLGITRIFGEFIKGITYFKDGEYNLDKPVYHRLMSCENRSAVFRSMYQQCNTTTSKKKIAKHRIETCYIERLIYDELYKNQRLHFPAKGDEERSQDEGHNSWLEQTKADFNSCFPNVDLKVKLEYNNVYPIKVTIMRYKNNTLVSIETYEKERYPNSYSIFVDCKLEQNKIPKQIKQKLQTFYKLTRWTQQTTPI
jgi:hypothetical protein